VNPLSAFVVGMGSASSMSNCACAPTAASWGSGQETCAMNVRMGTRRQVCAHWPALWGLLGLFVLVWQSAHTEYVANVRMEPVVRRVSTTMQHARQLGAPRWAFGAHHVSTNAPEGPVMSAAATASAGVGSLVMERVYVLLALLRMIAASNVCHHQSSHAGATVPVTGS